VDEDLTIKFRRLGPCGEELECLGPFNLEEFNGGGLFEGGAPQLWDDLDEATSDDLEKALVDLLDEAQRLDSAD
jgi:hypothetical protein